MTIGKAFKLNIDFDVLESIALGWGMEDQNLAKSGGLGNQTLQKIQLYAGAGKKPYVLLFSFSVPETRGLWGQCMNGFSVWQSGWLELKAACISNKAQNMENWRIFAHDESENQYLTIEYLLRNEKNTVYFDKDPEDMFDDASNLLPGLSKDDFIDDSWILTESGFKKHVLDDAPISLFENKNRLHTLQTDAQDEGFNNILKRYHADIGMFWESLSRKAKDRHGSIEVAQDFDLYDLAKEAYTDNSQHFTALKLADIDNRAFYSSNIKPKRKVVGSILQKIVWREQPHMFGHPEIRNNTQWLFDQFNNHGL